MRKVRSLLLMWLCCVGPPAMAADEAPGVQAEQSEALPAPPPAVPPVAVDQLPEDLVDWVPWVMSKHPDLACPVVGKDRACVWPGILEVDAGADGGRLSLSVHTDRDAQVLLPGGRGCGPPRSASPARENPGPRRR